MIRDNALIIDYFESKFGHPFTPLTPRQYLISALFDVVGAEGMYRSALHYRWNVAHENLDFFQYHFETYVGKVEGLVNMVMKAMHKSTRRIGVAPETVDVVEAVYLDQLRALDRHFAAHGYLLGGHPCAGDFSMMSPMFGHLGRDPKAIQLMLSHGARVFRWVERMNRPTTDLCEYEDQADTSLPNDEIPDTLVDALRAFAEDFVPETLAAAEAINGCIDDQDELVPGAACSRAAGCARFEVRGTPISAVAQPYRFFLLKRVQDAHAALQAEDKEATDSILQACDMMPIIRAKLTPDIGFRNNLEVWL